MKTRTSSAARRTLLQIDSRSYPRFVVPLVAFLPAPLAYGVALLRSDLRYRIGGATEPSRMETVHALKLLFGDRLTPRKRDNIARDYARMRSCETIDAMRLLGRGKALTGLVEARGLEHLKAALASGKGAVLCSAHFVSTRNLFPLIGALGFPVTGIAWWSYGDEGKKNKLRKLFYRLGHDTPVTPHMRRPNIERRRRNLGPAVQGAKVLRQNEFIGIMLDASLRPNDPSRPMEFNFLNRKAILAPGATTIAQITGAPVIMVLLRRSADWRHQILEITPPVRVEGDPINAFRQCLVQIEAAIERYPAQWEALGVFSWLVGLGLISPDEVESAPREILFRQPGLIRRMDSKSKEGLGRGQPHLDRKGLL